MSATGLPVERELVPVTAFKPRIQANNSDNLTVGEEHI